MPLAFAEILLQGDPGTTVDVSVLRVRKTEPQKITLTRAAIEYPAGAAAPGNRSGARLHRL